MISNPEKSSIVLTQERVECHYASYPFIFVQDEEKAGARVTLIGVGERKRDIPPYFSRKDGCNISGWRVASGECLYKVQILGEKPREVEARYKDGCLLEVK